MSRAPALDALRLLASLAVLLGHLYPYALLPAEGRRYLLAGLSSSLFCLMSGFVIVSSPSYWTRSFAAALRQRALRLLPPHWLGFALLLPLALLGDDRLPARELLASCLWWLSGLHNLAPPGAVAAAWNPPAWTITPLLLGGISLIWIRWARLRDLPAPVVLGTLLLLLLARFVFAWLPESPRHSDHIANLPRLLEVYCGGLAALLVPHAGAWLSRDLTLAAALSASLTLLAGFGRPRFFVTHGVFPVIGLLLVAAAYHNQGIFRRFSSHPSIVLGAQSSVWIWLLHVPLDTLWKRLQIRLGLPTATVEDYPTSILLTLAVSALLARTQSRGRS